ncbi:hypothetical protein GRX03_09310 [Halovenus sp. WSH3]|uniref:Uncharacterized protein n=1 Tax=Halovenus carboxidivorans TaxID=2692199 RepID=A0A6B0T980_9EURY|nr:hypothetical protein [Halovenus carboxidivorans]MXR51801.1 hypothetical protein [Halovenus carboxidivorans]
MTGFDSIPSPSEISETALPDAVTELLDTYDEQIGQRPAYLWRWLYAVFPRYRLSSVPDRHGETVREQKLLLTIYYTLLDDLADLYEDRATFMEARKLSMIGTEPTYGRPEIDSTYLDFTATVWEHVDERVRAAPRYAEFRSAFAFDRQQVINAMHHGMLVNEMPALATERGAEHYGQHNMAQFSYADLDLMYSPAFDIDDLRPLRDVIWRCQRLARISNWAATWERELVEGDLTSGVLVRGLSEGILSYEEVTDPDVPDEELADRLRDHGIETALLEEWQRLYDQLTDRDVVIESVDIDAYVTGMQEMREIYLDNRGRI